MLCNGRVPFDEPILPADFPGWTVRSRPDRAEKPRLWGLACGSCHPPLGPEVPGPAPWGQRPARGAALPAQTNRFRRQIIKSLSWNLATFCRQRSKVSWAGPASGLRTVLRFFSIPMA